MKSVLFPAILIAIVSLPKIANAEILIPYGATYGSAKINGVKQNNRTAPFGTGSGGCAVQSYVKTYWPSYTELTLTKKFNIGPQHKNPVIYFGVDNDVKILINGIDVTNGGIESEGCAYYDEYMINIPKDILVNGENSITIIAHDRGGESFFDMRLTADISTQEKLEKPTEFNASSGDVFLLTWKGVQNATRYRIVISQDRNFSGFIDKQDQSQCDSTCTTFIVNAQLASNLNYSYTPTDSELTTSENNIFPKLGANYIRIRAGNSTQPNSDWTTIYTTKTPVAFDNSCEPAIFRKPPVTKIPCLMNKIGWNYASDLMNHWFDGTGTPWFVALEDIKSFTHDKKVTAEFLIKELKNPSLFYIGAPSNPRTGEPSDPRFYKKILENQLTKEISTLTTEGQKIPFYFIKSEFLHFINNPGFVRPGEETDSVYYVAQRSFRETAESNHFTAAFGASSIRLVVDGYLSIKNGQKTITLTSGGVYFRDSYDFEKSTLDIPKVGKFIDQPLGFWSYNAPYLIAPELMVRNKKEAQKIMNSSLFSLLTEISYIDNSSFRAYIKKIGRQEGTGNFNIISSPEVFIYPKDQQPSWVIGE